MHRRLAAPLLALACGGTSEHPVLPLDETLAEDRARAGLITQASELIGGETAKGRVGDFKLYNSKIAIIIGEKDVSRGFHPYGGNIVDADIVRPQGEPGRSAFGEVIVGLDLTALRPTAIEVVSDGGAGGPAVIRVSGKADGIPLFDALLGAVLTASRPDLEFAVEYRLDPGADFVNLTFTAKNVIATNETAEIGLPLSAFLFSHSQPFLPRFGFTGADAGREAPYFAAFDDGVSYLYFRPGEQLSFILSDAGTTVVAGLGSPIKIRAQETISFEHRLIVGDGDVARIQARYRAITGDQGEAELSGRVTSASGLAISGAHVHILEAEPRDPEREYLSRTTTGEDGSWSAMVPPGDYRILSTAEGHPDSAPTMVSAPGSIDTVVDDAARLGYRITGEDGTPIPAKLSVIPAAFQRLPDRFGELEEPGGVLRTAYAITGQGTLPVRPGRYTVFASRGAEYEVAEQMIDLLPGAAATVDLSLAKVVDTTGWISTDTHVHAQLSNDTPDRYPIKVKAMVVEGLEMPISTEHEWIGDFNPTIEALGLGAWIKGVIGSEISTTTYGHFNGFPLVADPSKPGNGAINWIGLAPAETFAAIRLNPGDPFVQANHPRGTAIKGYFNTMGFDPAAFTARREDFSTDFDGMEVMNGCSKGQMENEMVDWFSFLNHGQRKAGTGSTDSHRARSGEMGFPRTYVAMHGDDPATASLDDFRAGFFAGRLIVTCGPFVDMQIGSARIGDVVTPEGSELAITARVSAPSWMDADRIDVIVNGEVVKTVEGLDGSQVDRFDGEIRIPAPVADAWVILRVEGDEPHRAWPAGRPSWAFTNPIFYDADRNGAWEMRVP